MNRSHIIKKLFENRLISSQKPEIRSLEGGVSSDIFLVTVGSVRLVVKQALEKLKVKDDWFSDIRRNRTERQFAEYMQQILPGSVPEVIFADDDLNFFVMEYLDPRSFKNWKEQLLGGDFDPKTTRKAAELLADLHRLNRHQTEARAMFEDKSYFKNLRTDPYLITTGERHPEFRNIFFEEAERLNHQEETVIHGDFSPKNILASNNRVVLLDHEVACLGDPAFDLAFLLNHLHLKMLWSKTRRQSCENLAPIFWKVYFEKAGEESPQNLKDRTGKLLLLLMLARIDGKSPVEYFDEPEKEFVRSFVSRNLLSRNFELSAINKNWIDQLKTETS
ncbi:MAG: aminoglycoside phosphotransferase family protein [Balneolaceae bacterium]|nr:aminoglycoside phosphotransferase family protein [Balneolaceae bacterium]